jgi:NTE family protein
MAQGEKPRIGLALGSGGARGWCHIGVLRGLADLGLEPDCVAGASMGALVGAVWAAGHLDALEEFARAMTRGSLLAQLDPRLSGGGLIGGAGIVAVLDRIGLDADMGALQHPCIAVAADLTTGAEVWLRQGRISDAVRASIALPGVIAPVQVGGRWLIDGGVVNPVPVSAARALGADVVIAVNPNARFGMAFWDAEAAAETRLSAWLPKPPPALPEALRSLWPEPAPVAPSYVDLVSATIDIMTDRIRRSRLAGDAPEVLLGAQLQGLGVLDFHRAAEAIDEGRRMVDRAAAQLSGWV